MLADYGMHCSVFNREGDGDVRQHANECAVLPHVLSIKKSQWIQATTRGVRYQCILLAATL
jgi:hypothetical protein